MDRSDNKMGKLFPVFAGLCILALPLIIFAALHMKPESSGTATAQAQSHGFDHNSGAAFDNYQQITDAYLEAASPVRTLAEYYSRRQYLGAPPFIPHKMADADGDELSCLTCHEKGGWTAAFQRHTPLTPHPEKTGCRQCHVPEATDQLFVSNNWISTPPPRLGRAHLPGGPPPIAHGLQMRENCIACHVGPGAVEGIRSNHASRGNCRQCHVPDLFEGLFERMPDKQREKALSP